MGHLSDQIQKYLQFCLPIIYINSVSLSVRPSVEVLKPISLLIKLSPPTRGPKNYSGPRVLSSYFYFYVCFRATTAKGPYFLLLLLRPFPHNNCHRRWGRYFWTWLLGRRLQIAHKLRSRYRQVEWNTWNCANGFGCLWSQGLHREIRKQRRLLKKSCSYAWLLKEMLLCSLVRWKLVGSGWWRWERKVLKVSVAQLFSEVLPLCAA